MDVTTLTTHFSELLFNLEYDVSENFRILNTLFIILVCAIIKYQINK